MTIWLLIFSVAGGQALLLAIALWRRPFDRPANRLLSAWMLLVCVDLGIRAWAQVDQTGASFRPMRLASLFPFLHASAFYLYVRTLISGKVVGWRDLLHGAGFFVALALSTEIFIASAEQIANALSLGHARGFWRLGHWSSLILFGYSVAYIVAAVRLVAGERRRLLDTRSDVDPDALRWLMVVAASQCVIWMTALVDSFVPGLSDGNELIYAAVAGWILLAGYLSLVQPQSAAAPADQNRPVNADAIEPQQTATATEQANDPRFDAVAERLRVLMEDDHLYRETALSIAQLARRSGYPEYLVSAVINRRFGCPFWDYINRYRVEQARDRLSDPGETRTALDIAYDCGFSSKSTFNAAFKRLLDETPSACRKRAEAARQSG